MADNPTHIDINLVRQRFEKSLPTYNEKAKVQQLMADYLIQMIVADGITEVDRLFEIGCGTGLLTQRIDSKLRVNHFFINDLVDKVEPLIERLFSQNSTTQLHFLMGDVNQIDFPRQCDLICSGAAVQWVDDMEHFFIQASQSLNHQGVLAFSTFGADNFIEIKQLVGQGLSYVDVNEMTLKAAPHFTLKSSAQWHETMFFSHPSQILQHIKQTGVGGVSNQRWTKTQLTHFIDGYEQFRTSDGFYPLTFHPQFYIFEK